MFKQIITALIIILSCTATALAQDTTAKGYVIDADTKRPVEGVVIRVSGTLARATSNSKGYFEIQRVPSDAVLKFSHVSYLARTISAAKLSKDQTVALTSSMVNIEQVTVTGTGTHRRNKDVPIPVTVFTEKDLKRQNITNLKEALLKLIPSVTETPLGSMGSVMTLNGLDDKYILFLVNGQRLLGSGSSAPDLSRVNLSNVKRIEVLDGAGSMIHGSDAIAGVVNIITNDIQSGVELALSSSLKDHGRQTYSVNLDAKEGKFGSYTSYNKQLTDGWILNPMEEDKEGKLVPTTRMAVMASTTHTLSQRFTYDFMRGMSLYAEGSISRFIQNRPEMINGTKTSYNYDLEHKNDSYAFGGRYAVSPKLSLFADYYRDHYTSSYNYFLPVGKTIRPGDSQLRVETRWHKTSLKGIYNLNRQHKLSSGMEYTLDALDNYFSTSDKLREPVSTGAFSFYAQDEMRFSRAFQAVVGARVTRHDVLGSYVTPNAAVMYTLGDLKFRGSYASGYKTPSLNAIYTFNVNKDGTLTIGDESLRPERSQFFSASMEYATNRLALSLGAYANYLRDKIELVAFEVTPEELAQYQAKYGPEVTQNVVRKRSNIDRARVMGLKVGAKAYLGAGFMLQGDYSLVDGKNLSAKEGEDDRLDKTIRHAGNVSAQWTHSWGGYHLNVNLTGELRGPRFSSIYSPRIGDAPGYSLWNINTTHTFELGKLILMPTVGIENIFNYVDNRPGYRHYLNDKGKGATTMSPYATITPGRTYYLSLSVRFKQ